MTIPFWCTLAAILFPYLWHGVASSQKLKQFGSMDNKNPRDQTAKLEGMGKRAAAAATNAFEALPTFGIAVTVNHLAKANPTYSMYLALAWVGLRLLHGIAYIADIDKLRSVCFALALACAMGMIILGAMG